jgi:transcriptional regulator with XRE-family HTH domain
MRKRHVGELITAKLKERGMSKAEFGRRISTSRQNVSLILRKHDIDTGLLRRICEALQHDFFGELAETIPDGYQWVNITLSDVTITGMIKEPKEPPEDEPPPPKPDEPPEPTK